MIPRIILFAAAPALLSAQTFIQMSDPQFGMYTSDRGFAQETANFEFAASAANRLKPAFVVITGDLLNKPGDPAQAREYHRIVRKFDKRIPVFAVPGNHDLGNEPTPASLAAYRRRFGPDYYTFQVGGITGIVLNSSLMKDAGKVPGEPEKMEAWFRAELEKARRANASNVIVFQHFSFFLKAPEEKDEYFNVPLATRARYLKLMHEFGVRHVFAGHYHRNEQGVDGDLEMVTTGPVGKPLGGAKSGFRVIHVTETGVTHQYFDFGDLPEKLN
jgi:serine/threonine-protein phosphatase CPPED1